MNQLTTRTTAVFATAMIAMIILGFAAVMTVSAQTEPTERPTDLTATAKSTMTPVSLTWTPPRTSRTDQTDWYAYPTTNQVTVTGLDAGATYKVRVRTRYDDNKKSSWSDVVTGQAGAPTDITPTNNPATGQPTITGNARVRETLTATTSNIADDRTHHVVHLPDP